MYNRDSNKRGHCIALYSGGLDSALAILLMLKQKIKVTALTFMTHFSSDLNNRSSSISTSYRTAEKFGFSVKQIHLGQKFIDIVVNPKYGRGKNMNVCIDCRILMLREAREFMDMVGAEFVITGEVLGQRPMSQTKDKLNLVLKQANLKGKLLRPLSAKFLPHTEPELSGLVDREQLEEISGRGRKRQLELADEFGLEDYHTPASGCLLTDAAYCVRLRDLLAHTERVTFDDLNLLKAGRHFRLDKDTKVIVGRNEQDNQLLLSFKRPHHVQLEALNVGSPITLLVGNATDENIKKAAMITARYTSAKNRPQVELTLTGDGGEKKVVVTPATDEELKPLAVR
jgi:tRNA U34 2-thiouridine synthase MnmA/TrmU